MREAVRTCRQLAASHTGYLKSLGRAAFTLTKFALGESLLVSDHTPPAVLVHRPLAVPSTPPPLLLSIQQNQRERELEGAAVVAEAPTPAPAAAARTEGAVVGGEELRMAVRHRSLAEVAAGLEEFFLKASDAGDKVSRILEASNADYKGVPGRRGRGRTGRRTGRRGRHTSVASAWPGRRTDVVRAPAAAGVNHRDSGT